MKLGLTQQIIPIPFASTAAQVENGSAGPNKVAEAWMKNQTKINVPTGLAGAILEAATTALAQRRAAPVAEAEVLGCREDARAVAIAVLVALGGNEEKAGLHPRRTRQSEELLSLADELDDEGE